MTQHNLILNTDSYKTSHFLQYPPGTEYTYSYGESRGGKWDEVLFFGLQAFLKEYIREFEDLMVSDPTYWSWMVDDAQETFEKHGVPFNRQGWEDIGDLGYLPIRIRALPEGSVVPNHTVLYTIENTDPRFPWLPSYLETALLRAVWYPTTVATNSYHCKKLIYKYLQMTCDNPNQELPFKLHDFGGRGVSSEESAALGAMAHLVNFAGTDTISGILAAQKYYSEPMAGFSIPASEHSTITSWGEANEVYAFQNMLTTFGKPGAIVACVSDSYDLDHAVNDMWCLALKDQVQSMGGTLVIRPDSGDPCYVVMKTLMKLAETFGVTTNNKGYKVLNPCVRIIQGDGIDYDDIKIILNAIEQMDYSTENIAFGMGGGLLQQVNRDTLKFAQKCSWAQVNGEGRDVFKRPVTDFSKASRGGRVGDHLPIVYEDGVSMVEHTFAEIRTRSWTP